MGDVMVREGHWGRRPEHLQRGLDTDVEALEGFSLPHHPTLLHFYLGAV